MILRWEAPGPYVVAFSSRLGGVSEGRYASLNLGQVGADPEQLALNRQVHGTLVRRAQAGDRGEHADGLWTDEPGLPMLAMSADCLPIALARRNGETPTLAVLHVGWRGLAAGIAASGVETLGGDVAAVIGPGIGPCCYEVGPEVAARFEPDLLHDRKLDLWTAAERALLAAGVDEVERTDICTFCNPDLYFSHRRDQGVTGRQGVIGLVA